ncbi:UPF0488 protein C8orf33 homolog isoform X1 [Salarias fasciatus]|uniref:UPF0488 protein C8orf33 homolog n=1 Tax=Salarias fasciatus TaxID=181472 RepID=A0A672GGP6_SALFA|nr:UPF0488 protein C8orf33 homolog isoform X1 [Salarias fasciatus]
MNEQKLMFIDIEPKSNPPASAEGGAERRLWNRSDNTFRFNFFTDSSPAPLEKTPPSDRIEQNTSRISFTGQGSSFAFNFQIPAETSEENMDTAESAPSSGSQQKVQEEKPFPQEGTSPSSSVQSKAKKKKKSGKKKPSSPELQKKPSEECEATEEPSAEEQLNRQLDWCIEQLELGLRSQKATPKQKEEASRALKTLRSSKAPLVKKRQLMRAMTGDYRKKMEEEKSKQFKLIQSEMASAHVKVASDSPKKSVFHRKAEVKGQAAGAEESVQTAAAPTPQTDEQTPDFVFVPSKEEFQFNFL